MSSRGQRTDAHPPKVCKTCGATFRKPSKLALYQWEKREFCSNQCRGVTLRIVEQVDREGRVKVWHEGRLRWRYHVVVEEKLGRPLAPGEVVDHINGDPTDDRPENLRVFDSHADHMAAHWAEGTIRATPGPGGTQRHRPSSEWPPFPTLAAEEVAA